MVTIILAGTLLIGGSAIVGVLLMRCRFSMHLDVLEAELREPRTAFVSGGSDTVEIGRFQYREVNSWSG